MPNPLSTFASKYRLKINRDEDHSPTIRGRRAKSRPGERKIASHYTGGLLSLSVSNPSDCDNPLSARGWGYVKRRCQEAGMRLSQDGDEEGVMLFDPTDSVQAKAAIKEAGARPKRKVSAAERKRLTRQLKRARAARGSD